MSSSVEAHDLSRPTIPIRYLAEILTRSRASSTSKRRVLEAAAIPRGAFGAPGMRVSIAQFERFYTALSRALDDELFGFLARPVPVGAYATVLHLLTGCPDLASALEAAFRFYRLFDRHAYWRLEVDRRSARLSLSTRDDAQARSVFFVQGMLLGPWRTAAWLAARPLPLDEIRLGSHSRGFRGEMRFLFGREPRIVRSGSSITFSSELLRLPVAKSAAEADRWTRVSLRELILAPALASTESELRAVLATTKPVADLSLSDAARRLRLSRASLARRLAQEGVSFQRLKDELRRDHAIGLLTGSSLTVADIAERLGYSAPSAFQRAFREWTGIAPGALRRRG